MEKTATILADDTKKIAFGIRDKIDFTWLTYTSRIVPFTVYAISYLRKFTDRIQKKFPIVYFEILNDTSVRVKGDSESVDRFLKYLHSITFKEVKRTLFTFYTALGLDLNANVYSWKNRLHV